MPWATHNACRYNVRLPCNVIKGVTADDLEPNAMGLPWSVEKILGWRSRYEAVQRWAARCESCYSNGRCVSGDFEDFFLAFMVVCYHLRDYIIETGGVRPDEIDRLIQASEPMRLCRDICNRSKHHTISRNPLDAQWSLGREYDPWPDGTSGMSHFLIAGSDKRQPMAAVRQCLLFWGNLVAQESFTEPPNPFSRH